MALYPDILICLSASTRTQLPIRMAEFVRSVIGVAGKEQAYGSVEVVTGVVALLVS